MPETTATLLGRRARLTIARASGSFSETDPTLNALVIEGPDDSGTPGLRSIFKVVKTSQKEPNTIEATIYNLAPGNRAALQQRMGERLTIEAGYAGTGIKQLCVGDVRTVDHVRDGADWKTVLKCGDGERAFRFARASESFAGGTTVGDVVKKLAGSSGLSLGNVTAQLGKLAKPLYHGWTAHGSASGELDRILRSVGYSYSIQDGQVQILGPGESVAQSIPLLSPSTGLIGSPETGTPEKKGKPTACKFKSLLMPEARPGGRVHLKSERYDGIFRIRKVTHDGDTMGGNWYTDFEAIADGTLEVA